MKTKILCIGSFIVALCFLSTVSFSFYDKETLSQERLAQWNINYASYLIDVGKYLDALDAYNTAFEVTSLKRTKLKVLLLKANLLSTFLDAEDQAINIYNEIIKNYPKGAEIALYRKGLLLFDMKRYKEAISVLSFYLKNYPRGRFRFQAEVLLEQAKKSVAPPSPPPLVEKMAPKVRVLLKRKAKWVKITGKDLIINGRPINRNAIELDVGKVGHKEIEIKSPSQILKVISGKYSKRIRGKLVVKRKKGRLMVINILDIEKYLWGVVPSESYPSWPLETLKAQAVASRTYAFYQILHRKNWDYDLVDNEGDQAYKGIDRETKKTTLAVNETRGLVLIEGNRPILAMYTANSGGYTADAGYIFKLNKKYLVAHPDPLSLKGKMSSWKRTYSISEIERRLRKIGLPVRGLKEIMPYKKGPSGRIVKIRIISSTIDKVYRTRTTLGRALKLPEILFSIEKIGDKIIFKGKGWGHGVGYSQWGSAEMGKKGYNFKKILKFYYPTTTIKKMW